MILRIILITVLLINYENVYALDFDSFTPTLLPQILSEGQKSQSFVYNRLFAKCLSARTADIDLDDCQAGNDQFFEFVPVPSEKYVYNLKLSSSNTCLEVDRASKAEGASITIATCTNKANQKIRLEESRLDPFYKKLIFLHSEKCLDAANSGLIQSACDSGSSQEFLPASPKNRTKTLPKIIWTFWDSGADSMPGFYKANVKHWSVLLGPDWEIRVVNLVPGDKNYYGNYIKDLSVPTPAWIQSKIGNQPYERQLNPKVIFSDFVRLDLLYKHGGVWMDASNILHRDLRSVQIPLETFDKFEVAGFTNRAQGTLILRHADSFENFFIAALPGSKVIQDWKENFRKYWNLKEPGMAIEDNPLYSKIDKTRFRELKEYLKQLPLIRSPLKNIRNLLRDYNPIDLRNLDVSQFAGLKDYLNQHVALKYTLTNNKKLLENIFILGEVGLEDKGPFSLLTLVDWSDQKLLELSPSQIATVENLVKGSLISKFPSSSSTLLRQKNERYFSRGNNIFAKFNSPQVETSTHVAKHVWTFWDKGEQKLPPFNQFNVMHWRELLEPLGYTVTVVNLIPGDPNNLETIIGGRELLPSNWDTLDSVVKSYQSPDGGWVKMVTAVVRSDFARLALLEKFGGIWMDSSNVLLKDLNAITVDALDLSEEREVGGYVMEQYASKHSPIVDGTAVDGMENWFIAAKAHSPLIHAWREAFNLYWTTRKVGEQIHRHPMYSEPNFDFGGLGISSPNYLNQHAALKYVLFHQPELAQKIYPVKHMQPWWFHNKVGGSAADLYKGFISQNVNEYAKEIHHDQVELLKFAGPHLTDINQHFKSLVDFCKIPNLLTVLYGKCPYNPSHHNSHPPRQDIIKHDSKRPFDATVSQ